MEDFQPQTPPEPEKYEHVDAMRRAIADLFIIFDTTLDYPDKGYVRFRGRFLQDPADCYDELALIYKARGVEIGKAREITRTLITNPKHALDTLAREELGLNPDDLGQPQTLTPARPELALSVRASRVSGFGSAHAAHLGR